MASSSAQQQQKIQTLALQIGELSKTYKPNTTLVGTEPELLIKTKELLASLQGPFHQYMSISHWTATVQRASIRTLLSLGAIQAIPTSGSISLSELESLTGAQASLLHRLLRVLVGSGSISLNEDGTYSHTPVSTAYAADKGGAVTMLSFIFDDAAVLTCLPQYLKVHGAREPDGEQAATHNPSTWFYCQEGKTTFEILEQDLERVKGFTKLMQMADASRPWTGFYDFGKLNTAEEGRPVLVDVGGADGTMIAKVLEAHPEMKPEQCILEDRPESIKVARENTSLPPGVQFEPHDFFQPQPVKHARAYLLRAICHDWSDATVVKILSHIVAVTASDSKVLIGESVLPEGGINGMAAAMDMTMLCIGGKERTRKQFEDLLSAAGLKLDEIYPARFHNGRATDFAIVEASLR